VVLNRNVEQFAAGHQLLGDDSIVGRWSGIAGGMVVVRITAAAPATIAAQKTSRGWTTDELRIPRVITVGPGPIN